MGGEYFDSRTVEATSTGQAYNAAAESSFKQTGMHDDCAPSRVVTCNEKNPIVLALDVTGSMSSWPKILWTKLPMFYGTLLLNDYLEEPSICFAAVADYSNPVLQVPEFAMGNEIDDALAKIALGGGGGSEHAHEAYETAIYYFLNKCECPNADGRPIMIITGDEYFNEEISPSTVQQWFGDTIPAPLKTADMLRALAEKYELFKIHKPYRHAELEPSILASWVEVLGKERVVSYPEPKATVDVMLGLIALTRGKRTLNSYLEDLRERGQSDERIEMVTACLRNLATSLGACDV